ncbi:chemotaxis protein CheB [Ensifer sp. OTU672]|uniref:chemotaxis protein CheB n=1 Tax=Ensifer sp. OTU672 TaxID=3043861 RepID=UPI00406BF335
MRPDIVAIGAPAGGVEGVTDLVGRLPENLSAAVLVVLHRSPFPHSYLPETLRRVAHLRVVVPIEGDPLETGACFVGPPDKLLTVGPGPRTRLLADGYYRGFTIDALFKSLAHSVGRRVIGVTLTGLLKDGWSGLKAIKEAGGTVVVEEPKETNIPEINFSAFKSEIDFTGAVPAIADFICERVRSGRGSPREL